MHHVIIYFSNSKKFLLTLFASWQNLDCVYVIRLKTVSQSEYELR